MFLPIKAKLEAMDVNPAVPHEKPMQLGLR